MNPISCFLTSDLKRRSTSTVLVVAVSLGLLVASGSAAEMFQPQAKPGGIEGRPTVTSLANTGTNLILRWYGLRGGYHVQAASEPGAAWTEVTNVLAKEFGSSAAFATPPGDRKFYRLQIDNSFVGANGCSSCHWDRYNEWAETPHASAWGSIESLPAPVQKNCIVCHTVGFGQPTGFTSIESTPRLAGVGCENCHGPSAAHKYGNHALTKPVVTAAAEVCGGCHDGSHHPTYSEWTNTAHATVTPEVASEFGDTAAGQSRMQSCGACHSGAARLALLRNYADIQAGYTRPLTLPSGHDASTYGITCAVCHDPHSLDQQAQLRNPLSSTNNFSLRSSSPFADQYDPAVQVCAQCHNDRGATWTSTSRPPHHSPQYNFLLGAAGVLLSGQPPHEPAAHALLITNQCVDCHMQGQAYTSEQQPASSGHRFQVTAFDVCRQCHSLPESLVHFTTNSVATQIREVKSALDLWATAKAPEALRAYGTRAWEYTTPGSLSPGGSGPSSAEQALIPVNIQKARFNLYLVLHDGSYGVHNGPFAIALLDSALTWVQQEFGGTK